MTEALAGQSVREVLDRRFAEQPIRRRRPGRVGSVVGVVVLALVAGVAYEAVSHGETTRPATVTPCLASATSPSITLSGRFPTPSVTVPVATHLVVLVPGSGFADATDVKLSRPILSEECSVLLADHGRRTIFVARHPGQAELGATVMTGGDVGMPAFFGIVVVTAEVSE